jgi:ABC-type multidrug transport system fused ATPase/permease subunit
MQEPTLFNYTVKENILYGKNSASNDEIQKASMIANACEFIESPELENAFDQNPQSLLTEWLDKSMKSHIVNTIGQDKYDSLKESLEYMKAKDLKEGKTYENVKDDLDCRTSEEKGYLALHKGYEISAGIRGSKLSGG